MATEMSWISLLANSRSRSTSQVLSTLPRRGSTAWVSLLRPILALPPAESPSTRKTSFRLRSRSEEHTSELQSPCNLVCRLLLEKKKIKALDMPTLVPSLYTMTSKIFYEIILQTHLNRRTKLQLLAHTTHVHPIAESALIPCNLT